MESAEEESLENEEIRAGGHCFAPVYRGADLGISTSLIRGIWRFGITASP